MRFLSKVTGKSVSVLLAVLMLTSVFSVTAVPASAEGEAVPVAEPVTAPAEPKNFDTAKGAYTSSPDEITAGYVSEIIIDDIKMIKDEDARLKRSEKGGSKWAYYNYAKLVSGKVVLTDGTVLKIRRHNMVRYLGKRFYLDFSDDQSEENVWGEGAHKVSVTLCGFKSEFPVDIIGSPIKSIDVEPMTLYKDVNSSRESSYVERGDDYEEVYWDDYDWIQNLKYTATMFDGTKVESTWNGGIRFGNKYYRIKDFTDDQSVNNPWKAGEHKVSFTILGFSKEINVTVVEDSIIKSVEVENISVYDGLDSGEETDYVYDPDTEDERAIKYTYFTYRPSFTVTLKDGTVIKSDEDNEVKINDQYFRLRYEDDQSAKNVWTKGSHKVNYEILGFKGSFDVTVEDNPIESVSVKPITLYEGFDNYNDEDDYDYDYDDDDEDYRPFNRYRYYPDYTVKLKDGTIIESDGERYVNILGRNCYFDSSDDQTYKNQWGVGDHQVNYELGGFKGTFNVTVKGGLIRKINVSDVEIYEGVHTRMSVYYDENDDGHNYTKYVYSPDFSVELDDGKVVEPDEEGDIYVHGRRLYCEITDDQSPENIWQPGVHKAAVEVAGAKSECKVTLLPTPIKSVDVKPVVINEGSNTEAEEIDDYSSWYRYWYHPEYSVTLVDGTVVEPDEDNEVYIGERWHTLKITDDQGPKNQWTVGEHEATATICGKSVKVPVTIKKTPIKSVTAEPVRVYEGVNQKKRTYLDKNFKPIIWNEYVYSPSYSVTLDDGTVLKSDYDGEVRVNGEWVGLTYFDDQNYNNEWKIGTHKVEAEILGTKVSFDVIVEATPVKSVSISDCKAFLPVNTREAAVDGKLITKVKYSPEFSVTLKDGTVIKSNEGKRVEIMGETLGLYITDDQARGNEWKAGTHKATGEIGGVSASFNVNVYDKFVTKIEPQTLNLYDGIDKTRRYYDDNEKVYYKFYTDTICKVIFADGSTVMSDSDGEFYFNNSWGEINFTDNQTESAPWSVGKYKATAEYDGLYADYDVVIQANPFTKLEISDAVIYREFDLYEGDIIDNVKFKVTDKTGKVYESDLDSEGCQAIVFNKKYHNLRLVKTDEDYRSGKIGKHKVTASVLGLEADFTVELKPSPVKSVSFSPMNLIENADGYESSTVGKYGTWVDCFKYEQAREKFSVTLEDGTVLNSENGAVEINGTKYYPDIYIPKKKADGTVLKLGDKLTVEGTLMDKSFTCEVNIIPSPVKSISIDPIVMVDSDYHYYRGNSLRYTVTLNDGKVLNSENGYVEYDGATYGPRDIEYPDLEYTDQGKTYKGKCSIMGKEAEYDIIAIKSPVKNVTVDTAVVYYNTNGEIVKSALGDYFRYDVAPKSFTVTFKDGTVLKTKDGYINYKGGKYSIFVDETDQNAENPWKLGGTYNAKGSILGYNVDFKVKVSEVPKTVVNLKTSSASIFVKKTAKINVSVSNAVGQTTFKSLNKKVATVNANGVVTAKKKGTAKIEVTNNGVKKIFTVKVKNPKLNKKKVTIKKRKTFKIKVKGLVGKAKFKSSKKKVAKVSKKGVVTAKKKGKATITVTANGVKLKLKVTVK